MREHGVDESAARPGRPRRLRPFSARLRHSPNTNSMVWLRCSRSSGVKPSLRFEIGLKPDMIATYCLPLTSNVIGGALKPVPTLIFHSGSMVASS